MGIIEFILIAAVIGLVIWGVYKLPIPAPIKTVILWAGVIVIVLILLNALGVVGKDVSIPKIR